VRQHPRRDVGQALSGRWRHFGLMIRSMSGCWNQVMERSMTADRKVRSLREWILDSPDQVEAAGSAQCVQWFYQEESMIHGSVERGMVAA